MKRILKCILNAKKLLDLLIFIIHAKENLMTELTSGIEYAQNQKLHLNIVFGNIFIVEVHRRAPLLFKDFL
jgi:hypothetical protein